MFFRNSHDEHKVMLARYLAEELSPAEKIRFMKMLARCRSCQRELQEFEEIRAGMNPEEPVIPVSKRYTSAVDTLRRLHLHDSFRERLLDDERDTTRTFALFPVLRVAGYALVMLLIITVPLMIYYSDGPADTPLRTVATRSVESAAPDPVTPLEPPPANTRRPTLRPPAAAPIPSVTEAQGIVLDSATLVLLTNYLSGNISQNKFNYVDLNQNGMVDAVDLAVILNFSVDNVTQQQLDKLLQSKPKPETVSPPTIT